MKVDEGTRRRIAGWVYGLTTLPVLIMVAPIAGSLRHEDLEPVCNAVGWVAVTSGGLLLFLSLILTPSYAQGIAESASLGLATSGAFCLAIAVVPPESTSRVWPWMVGCSAVAVAVLFVLYRLEWRAVRRRDEQALRTKGLDAIAEAYAQARATESAPAPATSGVPRTAWLLAAGAFALAWRWAGRR